MSVILFSDNDPSGSSYLESDIVFWTGAGQDTFESDSVLSTLSYDFIDTDTLVSIDSALELDTYVYDYKDKMVSSITSLNILFHRHFSGMVNVESTQIRDYDMLFEHDLSYGITYGPLRQVEDSRGHTGLPASGPVTGNSLYANTPDNSKTIIIDPVQGLVRVLGKRGEILFREVFDLDIFADVITITADNTTYWLLRWVSANYNGGNKFVIERRRIEDHTIVEMSSEEYLESDTIIEFIEGLESDTELLECYYVELDTVVTTQSALELDFEVLTYENGLESDTEVVEIRIELRKPYPKNSPVIGFPPNSFDTTIYNSTPLADERNLFPEFYNMETDVHRPNRPTWMLKTSDVPHEAPYSDDLMYVYGDTAHRKYLEDLDLEVEDALYVHPYQRRHNDSVYAPISDFSAERIINTRQVTAPHLVATETKLIFGTVKHRGAWPWENPNVSEEDSKRRSSSTLLTYLDVDTRHPIATNKNINASGAVGFQANDEAGIFMLDYYWPTGEDGRIKYFHTFTSWQYYKLPTFIKLDFDFNVVDTLSLRPLKAVSSYSFIASLAYTSSYTTRAVEPYDQIPLSDDTYPYLQTVSEAYSNFSNRDVGGVDHALASEIEYNGTFKLVGSSIVWITDRMLANKISEPRQNRTEGFNDTSLFFYPWDATYTLKNLRMEPIPHNRIVVMDSDFSIKSEVYSDVPHLSMLNVSIIEDIAALESDTEILDSGNFNTLESDFFVVENLAEGLESDCDIVSDFCLESDSFIYEDSCLESDTEVYSLGYVDKSVLITNTSLVESLDYNHFSPSLFIGSTGNVCLHPTGQFGTYPYGVRYWDLGVGYPTGKGYLYPKTGKTPTVGFEEWGGDALYHTPTICWRPRLPKDFGSFDPNDQLSHHSYNDGALPQPIQYISDNDNQALFGLYRLPEGRSWMAGYKELSDGYSVDDEERPAKYNIEMGADPGVYKSFLHNTGDKFAATDPAYDMKLYSVLNYPIGGVLHKYDSPNSIPVKSAIIPGYFKRSVEGEYDPFVLCRYFGYSPTNKQLYIIRAYGRPDLYHTSVRTFTPGISRPWVRLIDGSYTSSSSYLYKDPFDNYLPVLDSSLLPAIYDDTNISAPTSQPEPFPGLRGLLPSDNNVIALNESYYESRNHYVYMMTFNNFASDYEYNWGDRLLDTYKLRQVMTDHMVIYEQKVNIYDNRDILVYDYDLNLVRRMGIPSSIPDDEIFLHITERKGVFYLLTQKKGIKYNWAQFHATRAIGTPYDDAYQDDKYGYTFKSIKLYKVSTLSASVATLIQELPWAGHSVGDVLIQEVTDTHVWLNWSGVHKSRAGTCMGLAVRLDGSGFTEIPSMVAILKNYLIDGYTVLTYKNVANRPSAPVSYTPSYSVDHGFSRVQSEKWNRYGDGRVTKMILLDEATLDPIRTEYAYQPMDDTSRLFKYNYAYGTEVLTSTHPDTAYSYAPQPGYSQFYYRINWHALESDTIVYDSEQNAASLNTWITVTTGGPLVFS